MNNKSKKKNNKDDFFFFNKKKMEKMEKILIERINAKKLDETKKDPATKILNELNKKNTSISVSGEMGSGKTTVIDEALKVFNQTNTFNNRFMLLILWIALPLSILINKNTYNIISKKIAVRRFHIINVNLWNLFALRNAEDYGDKFDTAQVNHTNGKLNVRSFAENNDKKNVATHLFVKKVIWKSIASALKITSFINLSVKRTLENDIFSYESSSKRKTIFSSLKFWIFIFLVLIIPISFVFAFLIIKNDFFIENRKILISTIPPFFSLSSFLSIGIFNHILKGHVKEININEILIDPVYNEIIPRILAKKSKRKMITIHFSEIDRLYNWICLNNKDVNANNLIKSIITTIGLIYNAQNYNVIIETNEKIISAFESKELNENGNINKDTLSKLFNLNVKVKYLSYDEFIKIINKRTYNKKISNLSVIYDALNSFLNKPSWRLKDEYANIVVENNMSYLNEILLVDIEIMDNLKWYFMKVFSKYFDQKNNNKKYDIKINDEGLYLSKNENGSFNVEKFKNLAVLNGLKGVNEKDFVDIEDIKIESGDWEKLLWFFNNNIVYIRNAKIEINKLYNRIPSKLSNIDYLINSRHNEIIKIIINDVDLINESTEEKNIRYLLSIFKNKENELSDRNLKIIAIKDIKYDESMLNVLRDRNIYNSNIWNKNYEMFKLKTDLDFDKIKLTKNNFQIYLNFIIENKLVEQQFINPINNFINDEKNSDKYYQKLKKNPLIYEKLNLK